MNQSNQSASLARGWIEAWIRNDMQWLHSHLAGDFVHTSPFGCLEGRDFYLETVAPMAQKSVQKLVIKQVVAQDNQAAIWFENHTPEGTIPSCDWLTIEGDKILSIQSFYDSSKVRQVLSQDEQQNLSGSTYE